MSAIGSGGASASGAVSGNGPAVDVRDLHRSFGDLHAVRGLSFSIDPGRVLGFIGANGLKVHNGAVWVSNLDAGTLVRIGIQPGGTAGAARIRATGLPGVDDFDFVADGCDTVLVALNPSSQVVRVNPATGAHTVVLTAADGLSNPSSVAVGRHGAFVTSAAYFTMTDPNVLAARIR